MKLFPNLIFLSSVACVLSLADFSEIYAYLPFLKDYKAPPPCPMNEVHKICTSPCSDCAHRGICITDECNSGCDCVLRFYRVSPDGPCEPVANCPIPECGENEVFRECGPICERCTTMKCHVIGCDHKCYCKEGFLRNAEGKCIPMEECPRRERCYHNEEWTESGPSDEFCLKGANATTTYEIQDVEQCYCKEGHLRNALGYCINETLCQFSQCPGVEIYHDCVPKCNTTCRNYGNPNCTEDDNCYPGCFCPPGYVMNDFRSCILVEKCSLDIDQVKFDVPAEDETEVPDEEEESSDAETLLAVTTQATVEIKDLNEKTTESYLRSTEGSDPPEASDFKPTEDASSAAAPLAEDRKDSNDKSTLDEDNNTAK